MLTTDATVTENLIHT